MLARRDNMACRAAEHSWPGSARVRCGLRQLCSYSMYAHVFALAALPTCVCLGCAIELVCFDATYAHLRIHVCLYPSMRDCVAGVTEVLVETAPLLDGVSGGSGKSLGAALSSSHYACSRFVGSSTIGRQSTDTRPAPVARQMDPMASLRQMEQRMKEKRRRNTPWETATAAVDRCYR